MGSQVSFLSLIACYAFHKSPTRDRQLHGDGDRGKTAVTAGKPW